LQVDPTILEFSGVVMGQSSQGTVIIRRHNETCFKYCLEAVANTEDQFFLVPKDAKLLTQEYAELIGQDFSGGDVIAITEASGNDEDLIIVEQRWRFPKSIDMQKISLSAGSFESEMSFGVAIGSWGTQNKNAWFGHGKSYWKANRRVNLVMG